MSAAIVDELLGINDERRNRRWFAKVSVCLDESRVFILSLMQECDDVVTYSLPH